MNLKEEQPILYTILEKSFTQNKVPHAFLIVGNNAHDAAYTIAKSIICKEDTLACNHCNDCRRIDDNNYPDFIYVSGKDEKIKKGSVESIQERFSKSSFEGTAKIYLLENIENATAEAMNSLLKFLEEPEKGIYAIFTCSNINRVLPTIQSRCQVIQLLPTSKKSIRNSLNDNGVLEEDSILLSELFETVEECMTLHKDELFEDLKLEVYHFIEDLYFHTDNLLINTQTNLLKKYKEKETLSLFLRMLAIGFTDLFHVKQNCDIIYKPYKSLYDKIEDIGNISKIIEIILDTEYLLGTNANILLLMDSMMYEIQKEVLWKKD